ncbi:MAG: flagellar biosynthetic protein FliR [Phycisphaerales bacterium]|nr:flagellar biosynthetic protein FliR [Phycisphaerales bacterium]
MTALSLHIPGLLMVIFRIGGLMVFAPVLSSRAVPVKVRVLLAFVIGFAVYPVLVSLQAVPSVPGGLQPFTLLPLVSMEILIGVAIGLLASVPLMALRIGGQLAGQQMGLGFATFYDTHAEDDADLTGQLYFFVALVIFLAMSGLDVVLESLLHTFTNIPPGAIALSEGVLALLVGMLLSAFEIALRVAAPVLAILFLQSIALGYVSRTVPQLNILSLGFPLRLLLGFGVMFAGITVLEAVGFDAINDLVSTLTEWVRRPTLEE